MSTIVPFGPVPWPAFPNFNTGAPGVSTVGAISATGNKHASVLRGVQGAIRQVYLRTGTIAVGGALDLRIETVNPATGEPTGVLWAPNTNVTVNILSTDDNTWIVSPNLTADAVVTRGDCFAIVIVIVDPPGTFQFVSFAQANAIQPYRQSFTAAWAASVANTMFLPVLSDGSFPIVPGCEYIGAPWSALQTFTNATTTTGRGIKFDLAAPLRTSGCWFARSGPQAGDFSVRLYDTNGTTVLATTGVIAGGQRAGIANGLVYLPWTIGSVTLPIASGYRMTVFAESATNQGVYEMDVPTVAMWDAMPGGRSLIRSVFTSGAWVDTATSRGLMGLLVDGVSDGVSSGSLIVEAWQRNVLVASGEEHQKVHHQAAPPVEPWQRVEPTAYGEPWKRIWNGAVDFEWNQVRQVGA